MFSVSHPKITNIVSNMILYRLF